VSAGLRSRYLKELSNPLAEGLLQGQADIQVIRYEDGKIWLPMKEKPKQTK
jgi:hypothetical protein